MEHATYNAYMICANRGPDGERTMPGKLALARLVADTPWINLLNSHVVSREATAEFKAKWGDDYLHRSFELMNQADLFIGEASGGSDGRGAEFYYGHFVRKALMLMFRQQDDGDYPSLYTYAAAKSNPLVSLSYYQDLGDLELKFEQSLAGLVFRKEAAWQQEHEKRFGARCR